MTFVTCQQASNQSAYNTAGYNSDILTNVRGVKANTFHFLLYLPVPLFCHS
jgi:hypothetical protein